MLRSSTRGSGTVVDLKELMMILDLHRQGLCNCSRGRAAVQAEAAIGLPFNVRRMASIARTERRRAVSTTDLMSA